MFLFLLFTFFMIMSCIADWSLDTIYWQIIGGTYDGQYISSAHVCQDAPIEATSSFEDINWIMEPVDTEGNSWGFIVKQSVINGIECAWYLDETNYNQIRAYASVSVNYEDIHRFIIEPVNWWNSTFKIKNVYNDEYLYLNNVGRLKGNGDSTQAQSMFEFLSCPCFVCVSHTVY